MSAKELDTKIDVQAKAYALKVEQDRELELIDIIIDSIETENKRINTKLKFEDFQRAIDRRYTDQRYFGRNQDNCRSYLQSGTPEPKVEVAPESLQALTPEIKPVAVEVNQPSESMYYAVYRVQGTKNELMSVSQFLKTNEIGYTVKEQGTL